MPPRLLPKSYWISWVEFLLRFYHLYRLGLSVTSILHTSNIGLECYNMDDHDIFGGNIGTKFDIAFDMID